MDGWRRAPQDPGGDPRAYQNYGGGGGMGASGDAGYGDGACDPSQHQHGGNATYQGHAQTNYDDAAGYQAHGFNSNVGAQEGGYAQGGSYGHGFQTQDFTDDRNYQGMSAQGSTSLDDARGLMLFSQAQTAPQGGDNFGTSATAPMDLLALASTRAAPQDSFTAPQQQGTWQHEGMDRAPPQDFRATQEDANEVHSPPTKKRLVEAAAFGEAEAVNVQFDAGEEKNEGDEVDEEMAEATPTGETEATEADSTKVQAEDGESKSEREIETVLARDGTAGVEEESKEASFQSDDKAGEEKMEKSGGSESPAELNDVLPADESKAGTLPEAEENSDKGHHGTQLEATAGDVRSPVEMNEDDAISGPEPVIDLPTDESKAKEPTQPDTNEGVDMEGPTVVDVPELVVTEKPEGVSSQPESHLENGESEPVFAEDSSNDIAKGNEPKPEEMAEDLAVGTEPMGDTTLDEDERKVEVSIKPETPIRGELTDEAANALQQAIGKGMPDTPEGGIEATTMDSEPIDDTFLEDDSNRVVVAIQRDTPREAAMATEQPLKKAAELKADTTETSGIGASGAENLEQKDVGEKPSVAEESNTLPPPTQLPPSGLVSLRGKLERAGGVHKIHGIWALALDTILSDPENTKGLCLEFEYEHQPSGGMSDDFPPSGKYSGWFKLNSDDGLTKLKSPETDVDLRFIENREGYHNVEGTGSNVYGSYSITGTLSADGIITMCRKFVPQKPTPKPKRTKRVASRRSKPQSGKKKRGSSKGDAAKSGAPKKLMGVPRHKDSGKRYGVGKPGLLCDVCFFEEDGEVAQTPFIKCIYCNLVAHSACYPPTSSVDASGKFLCDVCTSFFHPSVNKAARTKNPADGNIPPPKPLPSDIEAKSDGRHHGEGIYCQLCARNDVLGGMKPTNSNSWTHLACLMSAESAFFDDTTAVGVQGALKKNRTELIKHKKASGTKPKCEECGGESGMLLKCKEDGCQLHTHPLCAEILDRLRVVENNGLRDVIAYKCELHSYRGQDACGVCNLGTKQNEMLECDKCQQGYHMSCLTPPLTAIPEEDWFCAKCS